MEQVFKKILNSNVYNLDGVAYCLDALAENEGVYNIIKLCVNGIENWNINTNYIAEYIEKEYCNFKNIIITNVICKYTCHKIIVSFNYDDTRYYKTKDADCYEDSKNYAEGAYIYKKTFVKSTSINIHYNEYLNFVNKHYPKALNELKE